MLHTWLPDNTIKLRFRDIFDDLGVAVLTHDENAKTLRLGPGYSILDENGSPLGAGGGGGLSGSGVANQIAFWTDTDELGGNAGFTFDPTRGIGGSSAFLELSYEDTVDTGARSAKIYLDNTDGALANGLLGLDLFIANESSGMGIEGVVTGINILVQNTAGTGSSVSTALNIESVAGADTNIAIKTGAAGDIVFGALAGVGTRAVMVDANGKLSAP